MVYIGASVQSIWSYTNRSLKTTIGRTQAAVAQGASLNLDVSATMNKAFFSYLGDVLEPSPGAGHIQCTALLDNSITFLNDAGKEAVFGINALCAEPA